MLLQPTRYREIIWFDIENPRVYKNSIAKHTCWTKFPEDELNAVEIRREGLLAIQKQLPEELMALISGEGLLLLWIVSLQIKSGLFSKPNVAKCKCFFRVPSHVESFLGFRSFWRKISDFSLENRWIYSHIWSSILNILKQNWSCFNIVWVWNRSG